MENERAIALEEERPREREDARHALAGETRRLAEVLRDHRSALRRAWVISRVREAGEALEENLELEEDVVLLVEREPVEPRLSSLRVLAAKRFETRAGLLFGSLHQAMELELSIIGPWSGGAAAPFFRLKAASPRSSGWAQCGACDMPQFPT